MEKVLINVSDGIDINNLLTPELNPSKQRCLPEFFTEDFKF
jgi:hypothetical protein